MFGFWVFGGEKKLLLPARGAQHWVGVHNTQNHYLEKGIPKEGLRKRETERGELISGGESMTHIKMTTDELLPKRLMGKQSLGNHRIFGLCLRMEAHLMFTELSITEFK